MVARRARAKPTYDRGVNNDDLRWLYRDEDDEHTKVLRDEDLPREYRAQELRPQGASSRDPYAAQAPQQYREQPRQQQAPPPPPSQPPRGRRRRRRRHPVRRFLLTVIVLWLAFLIGTPAIAFLRIDEVEGHASDLPNQPGTAVLLVGSDGREDLSPEDQRRLGTGSTEGRRTDTMMILYTSPTGKSVMLGLPRDSFVEIPGRGENKLNAAYAFGGAPLLIQTVEHNTGIRIDGYMEIGMLGLVDMVDAVGGVEVCPERAMQDRDAHLDIPAGCQTLDGVTALAYARMRKSDPRGDIGRMERQREVIGEIVQRAASPRTVVDPVRWWNLNMAVSKTLHRSEDTGVGTLFGAGTGLLAGWAGRGVSLTVPIANADARTSAGSSVLWDEAASQAVFEAIQRGDVDAVAEYQ